MTIRGTMRLYQRRDPEDEYVTMCYYIQKEFKLSIEEMKKMPASTFRILAEEMKKDAENQEKEYEKSRRR